MTILLHCVVFEKQSKNWKSYSLHTSAVNTMVFQFKLLRYGEGSIPQTATQPCRPPTITTPCVYQPFSSHDADLRLLRFGARAREPVSRLLALYGLG